MGKKLFLFIRNHRVLAVLLVVVGLACTLYPRFNRQDPPFIQPLVGTGRGEVQIDMKHYLNLVGYFRGTQALETVAPPFAYRPLVPYLASRLPWDPLLSFNLVNVAAISLTLPVIFFMFGRMGFAFEYRIIGCLLYAVSFPVFYYGPSGYLDATAMLIIFLIVMSRIVEWDFLLPLWGVAGGLTKETVVMVFPFLLAHMWIQPRQKVSGYVWLALGMLAYAGAVHGARVAFGSGLPFAWNPEGVFIAKNLVRVKTYVSFVLAFGLPGWFASKYLFKVLRKDVDRTLVPWMIGMASGLALFGYSFVSAYADGRFVWTAYPFMIGLSLQYFRNRMNSGVEGEPVFDDRMAKAGQ